MGLLSGAVCALGIPAAASGHPDATPLPVALTTGLLDISAVSATDIWAVGAAPQGSRQVAHVEHFDGSSWTSVPCAQPGSKEATFTGVAAVSASDVWAVGLFNPGGISGVNRGSPFVENWDGTSWRMVAVPFPKSDNTELYSVTASAADDVWVSGSTDNQPLLAHWDGTTWAVSFGAQLPGFGQAIESVSDAAPDDVWTLGGHARWVAIIYGTKTQHWNGTSWSAETPAPGDLNRILGLTPTDAWAVGYLPVQSGTRSHPLIEHWDGSTWKQVATNLHLGPNREADLRGISFDSPNDGWVVGVRWHATHSRAVIEHWDGGSWRLSPTRTPTSSAQLHAVLAISPTDVWAVGQVIMHWDGNNWKVQHRP